MAPRKESPGQEPQGPTGALARRVELADTPQMRFAVFVFLASSAMAFAQPAKDKERGGRTVFPQPVADPSPSPAPAPPARQAASPSEAMDNFFLELKAGRVDAAYDALMKDSIIAERGENVSELKKRTQVALDSYGPMSGYETVDEKMVGTTLLRRTCVSLNSDLPLRWRFYFYKSEGAWKLVDLRVDDGLVELFEEAGRAQK